MGSAGRLGHDITADCRRATAHDGRGFCKVAQVTWAFSLGSGQSPKYQSTDHTGLSQEGRVAARGCDCVPRACPRQTSFGCTLRSDTDRSPSCLSQVLCTTPYETWRVRSVARDL